MNMSEICQEVMLEELLKNKGNNTVTSPVSLDFVLYMLALGCSTRTGFTSLFSKLGNVGDKLSPLLSGEGVDIYNCLLVKKGMLVKDDYAENLYVLCNSSIKQFDPLQPDVQQSMETALLSESDGIITKVPDLSNIAASIVNATRFKGKWEVEFSENDCYKDMFFNEDKRLVASYLRGEKANYIKNETMMGIELHYADRNFVFFMLLPNDPNVSLNQCLDSLNYTALADLYKSTGDLVNYSFPEFEMDYTFDATSAIDKAASKGINCTFDDIIEDQDLIISSIMQGSKITVDREGTIAEAFAFANMANSFNISTLSKYITFNRPFLYGIKYLPTDNILFLGTCYSPEK